MSPRKNYVCFVHFCTKGLIRAQQDHAVSAPASRWQAGQSISDGAWNVALPGDLPDGNYDWLIGLYDAAGDGSRVHPQGVDEGTAAIHLGVLHLAKAGTAITFSAETNSPTFSPTAWHTPHLNNSNQVVDFGDGRTDGSVLLRREGDVWRLETWPRDRNFTLELNRQRFAQPGSVRCTGGAAPEVTPVAAGARVGASR